MPKKLNLKKVVVILAGILTLGRSNYSVDMDNVKVEKKAGASINDSRLVEGIVLDKEVVHGGMPKRIENAKIALVNSPLEVEKPEFDAKLNINNPSQSRNSWTKKITCINQWSIRFHRLELM